MKSEIKENILKLINKQQSLFLSTLSNNDQTRPFASYSPYAFDKQKAEFYVLLSDLSSHSTNLIRQPKASILIVEDESDSEQIFARTRLQFDVTAQVVEGQGESEELYYQIIAAMTKRLGDTVTLIESLADFHLFILKVTYGRYVEGFGRAFDIEKGLSSHLEPALKKRMNK